MKKEKRARLNVQALARRNKDLMGCILADPDHTIISIDLAAGEPTVSTHFSQDVNYRWATFDGVGKVPEYRDNILMIDNLYFMVMSVSPMGRDKMRQAYPEFRDNWTKDPDALKAKFKSEYAFHKMLCVAEDCVVAVKGKGYLAVNKVQPNDLVWDGEAWVHTDGHISMGRKQVISLNGTYLTPDHKVLTKSGWKQAQKIALNGKISKEDVCRLQQPSFGWSDVWRMGSRIIFNTDTWKAPFYFSKWRIRRCLETVRQLTRR